MSDHQAVSRVVDVLRGAAEVYPLIYRLESRALCESFLEEVLTALTSWLVVASNSLICAADPASKLSAMAWTYAWSSVLNIANSSCPGSGSEKAPNCTLPSHDIS